MAKHYLPVDREQQFLLPPSVQEFLPEDDLAWFLIDAVAAMDTTRLHVGTQRGWAGRAGYDPDMLFTLLVYAYCVGHRSSRRIEALCVRDLGFRLITGNRVIDHSTIAAFRAKHEQVFGQLFVEALLLCGKAGLEQVGMVAVDGTKIAASAGLDKTREREALQRERDRLSAEVERMMAEHAATDAQQDALFGDNRGDELPPELRRRVNRLARLQEALRQIEQARAEHDAQDHGPTPTGRPRRADKVAIAQRKLDQLIKRRDERLAKEEAVGPHIRLPGRRPNFDALIAQAQAELDTARAEAAARTDPSADATPDHTAGTDPVPAGTPGREVALPEPTTGTDPVPAATAAADLALRPGCSVDHLPSAARQGNPTDPDSRVLKSRHGRWIQGYNCQAAVVRVQRGRRLVLAAEVTQDANDLHQAVPMMQAATANAERAGLGTPNLFGLDAGYWSEDNLTAPGPDRLIAPGKNRTMLAELRANGYATDDDAPPPHASPAAKMRHRLRTRQGAEAYAQRAPTVEPAFGDIKHNRGVTSFRRRGKTAVDSEWKLINLAANLHTLHRHTRDLGHKSLRATIAHQAKPRSTETN